MSREIHQNIFKHNPPFDGEKNRRYLVLIAIAVLIIAAITLRLIGLGGSYWYDELCTIEPVFNEGTFLQRLECLKLQSGAAPLDRLLLFWWSKLGDSEYFLRLSPVLFGMLTLWAIYTLGTTIFNQRVGLIALLLLAFSHTHIMYSQELRFYTILGFFSVLSVISLLRYLQKPHRNSWIILIAVHTLGLYSGYYTGFVILFELIYVTVLYILRIWIRDHRYSLDFKRYAPIILGLSLSVLLFLPWVIFDALHEPVGPYFTDLNLQWAKRVLIFLTVDSIAGMIGYFTLFLGGVIYAAFKRKTPAGLFLLIVLGGPLGSLLLTNRSGFQFRDRQNFFILPFFILLAAAGVEGVGEWLSRRANNLKIRKFISAFSVISLSVVLLAFQKPQIINHLRYQLIWRFDWKKLGRYLGDQATEDDLIVYVFRFSDGQGEMWQHCLYYYLPKRLHTATHKLCEISWKLYERLRREGSIDLPRTIWYISPSLTAPDEERFEVKRFGIIKLFRPWENPKSLIEVIDLLGNYPLIFPSGIEEEVQTAVKVFSIFGYYEQAFEIAGKHPGSAQLHCELGKVAQEKGDYNIAKRAYQIAFSERPDLACIQLADIYQRENKINEAWKTLQAGAATGKNPQAMVNLGMLYLHPKLYRLDLAEQTYLETIDRYPEYFYSYYRLAQLYARQERYQEALDNYLMVIKLQADNKSDILKQCELMADHLVRLGELSPARKIYQAIYGHDPDGGRVRLKLENPSSQVISVASLHLPMDENTDSSIVRDSSLSQHHQMLIDPGGNANTEAHSTPGMIGRTLRFDGIDDAINIEGLWQFPDRDCAISLWYRLDTVPSKAYYAFGNYVWHKSGMVLLQQPNGLVHWQLMYKYGEYSHLTYSVSPREWNHFVCQRRAGVIELYANGRLIRTYSAQPVQLLNGEVFKIGATIYNSGIAFSMDDFRIYDRALSPEEIRKLSTSEADRLSGDEQSEAESLSFIPPAGLPSSLMIPGCSEGGTFITQGIWIPYGNAIQYPFPRADVQRCRVV